MPDGDIFDKHVAAEFRKPARSIARGQAKDPNVVDEVVLGLAKWLRENGPFKFTAIVREAVVVRAHEAVDSEAIERRLDRLEDIRVADGNVATENLVRAGKQRLLESRRSEARIWPTQATRADYEAGASILARVVDVQLFPVVLQGRLMAKGYAKSADDIRLWREDLKDGLPASPEFRRLVVHMVEGGSCESFRLTRRRKPPKMSQVDILEVSLVDVD